MFLGPISLVAIVVGWVIFNGRNWRCPACDNYLGRAFNPKHCRTCGIEFAIAEAREAARFIFSYSPLEVTMHVGYYNAKH